MIPRVSLLCLCALPTLAGGAEQRSADQRIAELEASVLKLQSSFQYLQAVKTDRRSSVTLDPLRSEFLMLDTAVAPLAVKLGDVQSYADGTSITISIGNVVNANIGNAKLTIEYGTRPPKIEGDNLEPWTAWRRTIQILEHSHPGQLRAGAWTPVKVALPNIKPADLGYVNIEAEVGTIGLD